MQATSLLRHKTWMRLKKADLVNMTLYSVVKDQGHKQLLHIWSWDVELLGHKGDADAGVGLNELHDDLRPDVLEQVVNVLPDEAVIIDCGPAVSTQPSTHRRARRTIICSAPLCHESSIQGTRRR